MIPDNALHSAGKVKGKPFPIEDKEIQDVLQTHDLSSGLQALRSAHNDTVVVGTQAERVLFDQLTVNVRSIRKHFKENCTHNSRCKGIAKCALVRFFKLLILFPCKKNSLFIE